MFQLNASNGLLHEPVLALLDGISTETSHSIQSQVSLKKQFFLPSDTYDFPALREIWETRHELKRSFCESEIFLIDILYTIFLAHLNISVKNARNYMLLQRIFDARNS